MAWITYEKTDGASKIAVDIDERGCIILTTDDKLFSVRLTATEARRIANEILALV
ncbi:hypothetical protein LCGC14_2131480 [marine sediment metagenome]|uniref:Uncharacterized protein n=1 Tax=marine sediment metagenome TaxID=412755 RepID=A0A0F9E195_9ZZZZ